MPRMTCPECRQEIADHARVCTHCGCPVAFAIDDQAHQRSDEAHPTRPASKSIPRWVALIPLALSIAVSGGNIVVTITLLVTAFSVWTNLGRRPFFPTSELLQEEGARGQGGVLRWIILGVILFIVGGIYYYYNYENTRRQLPGTWQGKFLLDPGIGPAGVGFVAESDDTLTLNDDGSYENTGPAKLRLFDGNTAQEVIVTFDQDEAGHWFYNGMRLVLTPETYSPQNVQVQLNGQPAEVDDTIELSSGPFVAQEYLDSIASNDDPIQIVVLKVNEQSLEIEPKLRTSVPVVINYTRVR